MDWELEMIIEVSYMAEFKAFDDCFKCYFVGVLEILKTELLAILYGLHLCWERGFRRIVIFSDSKHALSLLEHGCGRFHAYAAVLGLVRELLGKDWVVRFDHILREGNSVVDYLAKDGARGTCRMRCLDTPPTEVTPMLADDYRDTLFMRR
ncbi:uncharacterized protein LOC130737075 [Lotus japonicus]|uniref:uncharacterized protein LOC130737075 n=1 Tax=Lotus japonicus TaxID=34305 RepID=UPI0025855B3C|nr:uncharacterized protein LOC130737075 [Lotus japonicus]